LWYNQNRLNVPEGRLRDVLLKECHDEPLASCGPWGCKAHHNIPQEVILLAQVERGCRRIRKDLLDLPTKPSI